MNIRFLISVVLKKKEKIITKKRIKFLKGKNNHARSIIFSESRFYEFLLDDLINLF